VKVAELKRLKQRGKKWRNLYRSFEEQLRTADMREGY